LKKVMKKYNFVKVITLISILVLFFAQSVYDPSVHARMKKIEDESLSDIDAAALDIDLILTIRSVVTGGFSFSDGKASPDSINIGTMEIGNANLASPSNFFTNTSMAWDIGFSGTQTWLEGGNIFFPIINPGMGLNAVNVFFKDGPTGKVLPIGNLTMKGVIYGEKVFTGLPNLDPFTGSAYTTPWVIISSRNQAADRQGLKFFSEVAAYVNEVSLGWRGDPTAATNTRVVAQGIYVYGMMNETSGFETPGTWATRQGMLKMGGTFPLYNNTSGSPTGASISVFETIDIGSSGAANASMGRVDLPVNGSLRIKQVQFGSAIWGPFCLDDISFYVNRMYLRETSGL
jgi:hypothetical protein